MKAQQVVNKLLEADLDDPSTVMAMKTPSVVVRHAKGNDLRLYWYGKGWGERKYALILPLDQAEAIKAKADEIERSAYGSHPLHHFTVEGAV